VVTAHYDGLGTSRDGAAGDRIYNGADDNATGVAVMLEAARLLSRQAPSCPLLFAAVSGEELGLWGSDFLARSLASSAPAAVLNIDMVGRPWTAGEPGTVLLTTGGDARLSAIVDFLKDSEEDLGVHIVGADEDPWVAEQGLDQRSDQASFRRRGVPALFMMSSRDNPSYHQPSDEVAGIDQDHLTLVAETAVQLVRALSSPPKGDRAAGE
jgi:Zn-dependent M28 family amino/carboxypeptidase